MRDPHPRSPELMAPAESALLVIDLQERLAPVVQDSARVAWNCRRLAEGAAALGVPAAATEQYPEKLGATLPELAGHLAGATPKRMFSCRECGPLLEGWQAESRFRVLLAGIETHVCVLQTALDLLSSGFRVSVAVDAVGSRHGVDHEIALRRMESCGVTLTTTESALFEWCGDSRAPAFKAISALAKETGPAEG